MPDEAEQTGRGWLIEPVAPNELRIHVELGDGVEISEEARTALETILDELQASEVQGFSSPLPRCPSLRDCGDYRCDLGKCAPLTGAPCFVDASCFITKVI